MGNYSMWEIYRAKIIAEGYKLEGVRPNSLFAHLFFIPQKGGASRRTKGQKQMAIIPINPEGQTRYGPL